MGSLSQTLIRRVLQSVLKKITLLYREQMGGGQEWKQRELLGRGFRSPGRWWWFEPGQYLPTVNYNTKWQLSKWQSPSLPKFPYHLWPFAMLFSHKWILCFSKFCHTLSNNMTSRGWFTRYRHTILHNIYVGETLIKTACPGQTQ